MTDRILFRARAWEQTVSVRTYAPRTGKSPQQFYITYSEFDRLQRDGRVITSDIHSFAQIRLDEKHDRVTFEFTWLTGRSFNRVEGREQTVHLRWSGLRAFLQDCRQPDGPDEFKAVSLDVSKGRPRLVFNGNRANLKAAIGNPVVRHKLAKALARSEERRVGKECYS